jgi:hypothetical protein
MKNYVGRKIRGFRFEDGTNGVEWNTDKKDYIGVIGEIICQHEKYVIVQFKTETWSYPISLIEPHLIEEDTPKIIDLSNIEGVEMMVKDQRDDTLRKVIIKATVNNRFVDWLGNAWYYARPIPQLPKYTHAELVEKLGHDFEYINK